MYKAVITEEKDWDAKRPVIIHFDNLDQIKDNTEKIQDAMNKIYDVNKKMFFDLDFRKKG